jgi:hypothetical protein
LTRDMDLIRELLLKLENLPLGPGAMAILTGHEPEITVDGYSGDQIEYHLVLLKEAGFIECLRTQPMEGVTFRRLSWHGHDFLDSVRSPEVWNKTKKGAEAAGGFTVDLLKDLAKGFVKKQIEEYTGVKL